jgi:cytochrome c
MRPTWIEAAALAFAVMALASLAAAEPAFAAGSVQRGKIIAETNCAGCHAIGPTGDSPNAKAPAFRTLSQRFKIENLEEALAEGITVGHQGLEMPEFRFDPPQIEDFLAYLKSVQS